MRNNVYKYELLSIIETFLESKKYENNVTDILKYFSPHIKDLEFIIDNTSEDIEKEILENNDVIRSNIKITNHLLYLKEIIKEDVDY
jgi:hypothetical protein